MHQFLCSTYKPGAPFANVQISNEKRDGRSSECFFVRPTWNRPNTTPSVVNVILAITDEPSQLGWLIGALILKLWLLLCAGVNRGPHDGVSRKNDNDGSQQSMEHGLRPTLRTWSSPRTHMKKHCHEAGPAVRARPVLPLVRVPIGRQVELVRLGRSARSR